MINPELPGQWLPFADWEPGNQLDEKTKKKTLAALQSVGIMLFATRGDFALFATVDSDPTDAESRVNLSDLLLDMFRDIDPADYRQELEKLRETLDALIARDKAA